MKMFTPLLVLTAHIFQIGSNATPTLNPSSGNWYDVIDGSYSWTEANGLAPTFLHNGVSAHLATITSEAENQFVAANLDIEWSGAYWIGGFQSRDGVEPAGGWQWVTGEPWEYTKWGLVEPNNEGEEDHLQFSGGAWNFGWNDLNESYPLGFIIEFGAVPVPEVVSSPSIFAVVLLLLCHRRMLRSMS